MCRTIFLLEVLGENSFSYLFQLLEVTYIPWLQAHSSTFKVSIAASFLPSDLMPPSYKDFCGYIGPIWIIQDNVPISRSILNLIIFAKFLLPCSLTDSELPMFGMWKFLRSRYSVYHR